MSWPRYSGGGQIYPQSNQNNPNQIQRQLQIMQMQMQLQHKIQAQKQHSYNPPKSQARDQVNTNNKAGSTNASNNSINQNSKASENDSKSDTGNQTSNGDSAKKLPASETTKSALPDKSSAKVSTNQPVTLNTTNDQNKAKSTEKPVKIEPPSPQTPRQNHPKISLMGNPPPLMPNPPPPSSHDIKVERNASQSQVYNSSSGSQNNRANDRHGSDYQRGASEGGSVGRGESGSGGRGEGGSGGRGEGGSGGRGEGGSGGRGEGGPGGRGGGEGGRGGGRWNNPPNPPRPAHQNEWQEPNSHSAYQEGGNDYNKSAGGRSGSNYQSNSMSEYDQHNRHGRNMSAAGHRPTKPGPPPYIKSESKGYYGNEQKGSYYGSGGRFKEKMDMTFAGPLVDLEPLDISEKKFNAYSKVFVGNIPKNVDQEELLALFKPYGEIGPTYINKDSAFGFLTFDFKANAAKAVREVDNKVYKSRYLKVRFATINEGIRVRNLSPYVSNELLEKAFSVFGTIESCRVVVDDRGNPKFEGIVVFKEKRCAALALKKCQEECFYLSGAMRPIIATAVEPLEDPVEGYPESIIPQNEEYKSERKVTPHFADQSSFEFEFGNQWKKLYEMYDEKKAILDRDFQIELERLEKKMVLAKVEYETEKLRKELAEREAETAQLRRHFGAEDYRGRPASPGLPQSFQYSSAGTTAADYDGSYGAIDQGYEAAYNTRYGEGYDGMAGYSKPEPLSSSSATEFDGGYSQQSSSYDTGYGSGYGRDAAGAGGYPSEPKYDRSSGGYDRSVCDVVASELNRPTPPIAPVRQKYESIPEPPSFKRSPEPLIGKDPYQVMGKRPRY